MREEGKNALTQWGGLEDGRRGIFFPLARDPCGGRRSRSSPSRGRCGCSVKTTQNCQATQAAALFYSSGDRWNACDARSAENSPCPVFCPVVARACSASEYLFVKHRQRRITGWVLEFSDAINDALPAPAPLGMSWNVCTTLIYRA
jgi:hypothetical protein